jgi:carotenoid 1,2-hydratase
MSDLRHISQPPSPESEPVHRTEQPHVSVLKNSCDYWHFDALSDDGAEALIIRFYSNYPFSSRYFKHLDDEPGVLGLSDVYEQFPAVTFTYSVNGVQVLHTINEFEDLDLTAAVGDGKRYSIADSSFSVDDAAYGSGYMVRVDLSTALKRRLHAEVEWLSIETGTGGDAAGRNMPLAAWELSVPRADVSGRIISLGRRGEARKTIHFRGTGYVDHVRGRRSGKDAEGPRCWGRAHFPDSTVIFQHFGHHDSVDTDLFVVRDGVVERFSADCRMHDAVRDRSGLKIPHVIAMSADGAKLEMRPVRAIHTGLFEVQMLSEITLALGDGGPHRTLGLTEFSDPGRMKNPVYRWLADLRTGKKGRSPLF